MAVRRRRSRESQAPGDAPPGSPLQQDEADVVADVEAEPDTTTGDLQAEEAKIRELGAVDVEAARTNAHVDEYLRKKRGNVKDVPFNVDDLLMRYDTQLRLWPTNSVYINLKRLTGTPVQYVIRNFPRSGVELYGAIMALHGAHPEAEYQVDVVDSQSKQYRIRGRITMPDTTGQAQQGQQPMNQFPPGYAYPPPPAYPPQMQPPPGTGWQAPPPQPQQPPQGYAPPPPQPAPVVVQAPAPPGLDSMMSSFQQMFEMFQRMSGVLQPPQPQPQPQQQVSLPPPPTTPDMGAMMAWFQQMLEMAQRMNPQVAGAAPAAPGPAAPNPMMAAMMGMPPMQPPPGMFWVPGWGFVPVESLVRAMGGGAGSGFGPRMGRSFAPGEQERPQPMMHREPPAAPQQTPADQFRSALAVVRSAADTLQEITDILPGHGNGQAEALPNEDDDSPVRIVDTGHGKMVFGKEDGKLRLIDSGIANLDRFLKWAGEQGEVIRKANAQQAPAPQRSLPPGHYEVGPGFQPPPGMRAVVVEESSLPPPPAHIPPPISESPPQRPWNIPTE